MSLYKLPTALVSGLIRASANAKYIAPLLKKRGLTIPSDLPNNDIAFQLNAISDKLPTFNPKFLLALIIWKTHKTMPP